MDRLAEVYETFEDTRAFVEKESAEGGLLLSEEEDAIDQLEAAWQHQTRILDELKGRRKSLDSAFREFSNCRALHEAAWADLKEVSLRHIELKRKANDAHERTQSPWGRFRRVSEDHVMAEEVLNDSLGCLGTLVKDTAGATHALTCGVPDRESNETKYLEEALEVTATGNLDALDGPLRAMRVLSPQTWSLFKDRSSLLRDVFRAIF